MYVFPKLMYKKTYKFRFALLFYFATKTITNLEKMCTCGTNNLYFSKPLVSCQPNVSSSLKMLCTFEANKDILLYNHKKPRDRARESYTCMHTNTLHVYLFPFLSRYIETHEITPVPPNANLISEGSFQFSHFPFL